MSSLLNLQRYTESPAPEPLASEPEVAKAPAITEEYDYEIVLDRGQFAGIGLVAIVLVAVFSGVSYLIGKSMASKAVAATTAAPVVPAPVPQSPAPSLPQALPQEPALKEVSPKEQTRITTAPLFADAVQGKTYLQVGVIAKGPAAIWAEGLRTHGLDAFVATGPSDGLGLWRVMIGPLSDPQALQRAKNVLGALELTNFGPRISAVRTGPTEAADPPGR